MKYHTFKALNEKHHVLTWRYFRQKAFRRKHQALGDWGYCCALVHLWWLCIRQNADMFAVLSHPTPTLLEYLKVQQVRSAYVPGVDELLQSPLAQADKRLLELKYGTGEVTALRGLLKQHQTEKLLDIDIALHYGCEILHKDLWFAYTDELAQQLCRHYGSADQLKVLIVRYPSGKRGSNSEKGHRMGIFLNQKTPPTFFDPNHGQVICASASAFEEWFQDFWTHTSYQKRLQGEPSAKPCITLYHLTPSSNVSMAQVVENEASCPA